MNDPIRLTFEQWEEIGKAESAWRKAADSWSKVAEYYEGLACNEPYRLWHLRDCDFTERRGGE